jgi:hypothetical protein
VDPQNTGAEGMEGRDPHLARVGPHEERHAILHLASGFVSKGYGQYFVGRRKPLVYKVSHAMRKDTRLAATGPSEDE